MTLQTLFLPMNFKKHKQDIEYFHTIDILLNRVHIMKFNQLKSVIVKGKKIKFISYPKGGSFGSCAFDISIDKQNLFYMVDYSLQKTHITPPLHPQDIFPMKFDYVITYADENMNAKHTQINRIEKIMNENQENIAIFLVIPEMTQIIEVLMKLSKLYRKKNNFVVYLPDIYKYYLDIIKMLSEYMIQDIA